MIAELDTRKRDSDEVQATPHTHKTAQAGSTTAYCDGWCLAGTRLQTSQVTREPTNSGVSSTEYFDISSSISETRTGTLPLIFQVHD